MRRWLTVFIAGTLLTAACAPRIAVAPETRAGQEAIRVVRAGHATVWVDVAGFRVLTDPLFVGWLWFFPRNEALGLDPAALPPVDAAVISHSHMDHFDPWSLAQMPAGVPVFFPPESARYHAWIAPRPAVEFAWWQTREVVNRGGIVARITSVPAAHWGGRLGFDGAWNDTYGSWIIEAGGRTVYFAGDTGWDEALFREIARRFPRIDLALIPIGPTGGRDTTRFKRFHIGPPEAIRLAGLLQARRWIPIHYGAFRQGPLPADEPLHWLRELIDGREEELRVTLLEPGQAVAIDDTRVAMTERASDRP